MHWVVKSRYIWTINTFRKQKKKGGTSLRKATNSTEHVLKEMQGFHENKSNLNKNNRLNIMQINTTKLGNK